jgi:hypothetical protein
MYNSETFITENDEAVRLKSKSKFETAIRCAIENARLPPRLSAGEVYELQRAVVILRRVEENTSDDRMVYMLHDMGSTLRRLIYASEIAQGRLPDRPRK